MGLTENVKGLSEIDELCVQTIRFLSMEAVQEANSGHPGMPMGMAGAAYHLWMNHMRFNPKNPNWMNRDRFVLSAGHGSMLLYSLLYLTGFDLSLVDLKNFRQWGSRTPGHPEFGHTAGVEATTGPLGQGLTNAVGMAIAEKYLADRYNKEDFPVFDYNIYSIAGDGCLQEGITSEASSLAGHLGLDNLIVIYDDNHITIDGDTSLSFTEDVAKRYEAYGWYVQEVDGDGNNIQGLQKALENAKAQSDGPSLIKFRSLIGHGSPKHQGKESAHGAPLGEDEIKVIKEKFGWEPGEAFVVPQQVLDHMQKKATDDGQALEKEYNEMFARYAQKYPELAKEIEDALAGRLPVNVEDLLPDFEAGSSLATRKASGAILNAMMPSLPLVLGGSADLTPSNNTLFKGAEDFQKDNPGGRYIRYGVREHAMGAVMNGISLSGLLKPYGGTFLVFSDYMRPAIRVAALSNYPTIFLFTHDSIGLGEDGPTHQPVEHIASLRAIPNLKVFRPADANETAYAWKYMLEHNDGPMTIALTRQGLPVLDQDKYGSAKQAEKGAYVLVEQDNPDVLLLATGSEVQLALGAAATLANEGIKAQVVSMPCWELFEQQDQAYKEKVLPPSVTARVGVEAGVDNGWWKYLGTGCEFVGMSTFGASAPAKECFANFGITGQAVTEAAKKVLNK
ncbi:Transketolase [Anaerohalosphaera lusitana]|uniref:Transketolase n=1 Tax=Anaerohalosphaera lusitana TaxID=1936003 RepID=A0A1U9NR86_9BACT|nr:transketolase [Anaerohalosphaera lusitana]AQT70254.1 Transketolase [Anaerohalosphaera lusitana]